MSSKRQQLVDTAIELFTERGFHGTGIDLIAKKAGVTKRTLYHHFQSKDELVISALKHYDGVFRNQFMRSVTQKADTPEARLLAVFDVAYEWFTSDDFFGCMFINVIGEFSHSDSAIREAAQSFKRQMRRFIEEIATQAGASNPDQLASSLALLLEGAIVTAQVADSPESAAQAKVAARVLIESALAPSNARE